MVEPTQREVDQALASSMKMFERVQLGEVTPIEPRPIKRLLLALDGSTQDVTATAIARALARRFSAEVSVLAVCARAEQVAAGAMQEIGAGAIVPATGHKDNFEVILAAIESTKPDLLLAPCPFGRDFEQIGPDSAGTVVDVLIARSGVPLLVIREPHEVAEVPFRSAALTLVGENAAAPDAAAWAATLVAPGGHFELVLVLEEEFYENVSRLLESMEDHAQPTSQELSAALQKAHVRLHRALQKSAARAGFEYGLLVMQEGEAREFLQQDLASLSLVVVALERPHHVSQGYASHCVRHSRQPVLIVPSR
jgi:uncharacterized protein with PIN domain